LIRSAMSMSTSRTPTGARIYLGARAEAEYEFTPLADGESVALGRVRLGVLETPGHSPESISILVYDLGAEGGRPHAVLSGDTLFVGDVGRPDLRASMGWTAQRLGELLYDSLHSKLLTLPDETLVYPAHGAGSLCGKNLSTDTVSTIGVQRRYNHALQPMSRAEFVRVVTAEQPETPPYFSYDAVLNTKERPTLEQVLAQELRPLALGEALALVEGGAVVLDSRDPGDFAGAHLAGSVNVSLGGSYATWAGTVLGREQPLVILADPGREGEAALRLGRIGFDNVTGLLDGECRRSTRAQICSRGSSGSPRSRSPNSWRGLTHHWSSTCAPSRSGARSRAELECLPAVPIPVVLVLRARIVAFRSLLSFFSSDGV
jgi:hydroxyacylglutathione hydrolase